jgi:acyl-CoA synthetase (AMP-forming)/AMP-acid ligase II
VISGGENVYCAEVERALIAHPGVQDVAVIGVADERWGESVAAVVVRSADVDVTLADVVEFCEGRLAPYKRPKHLFVVDVLPRNSFGKVQKQHVRTLVADLRRDVLTA